MDNTRLDNTFTFSVEPYNGKLRFVVSDQGKQSVCRIERKKTIECFLHGRNSSIFKGRLQLHKLNNDIAVEVKGEVVGNVSVSSFQKLIS
jgi:S-adenosylmethionine hydrolase